MCKLDHAAEVVQEAVTALDPTCLEGRDAARLTEVAALIERLGATAKMLLAHRAVETNSWRRTSHAATSEQWLADRVVAAATDEAEARARAHRDRHLRTWTNGFATHGTFSGPTEDVAKILHALEPLARARFDEARRAGMHESQDVYRFDAMVRLAEAGTRTKKPQPHAVRVRVDLPALVRGKTEPGETCEIPGVGPIPVDHAREVLSHGLLQLVITDGVDVRTVVSNTHPPLRRAEFASAGVSGIRARGPREFCRRRCLKPGTRARMPQDP
jgi:hypothetical protein